MKKYTKNLILTLVLILIIYLSGLIFWPFISKVLMSIPLLRDVFLLVLIEFNNRSIIGLSLITFFGSLFFIGFPGELVFLIYAKLGYNLFFISFIMILFTIIAQTINYGIGYYIEKKLLEKYIKSIKSNKRAFLYSLKKYDVLFIIVINLLPLPADILSVILGIIKYDFKKTIIYTTIGKILKFLFLIFIFVILNLIQ